MVLSFFFLPLYPFLYSVLSATSLLCWFHCPVHMFGKAGVRERKWETHEVSAGWKDIGGVSREFLEPVGGGVSFPLCCASPSSPNPQPICVVLKGRGPGSPAACCLWALLQLQKRLPASSCTSRLKQLTEAIASLKSKFTCSVLETMKKVHAWLAKMGRQIVLKLKSL